MHKPECGPKPPVVAEALSSLAYLCFKLGEWGQGNIYLEKAVEGLQPNFGEGNPPGPSVS